MFSNRYLETVASLQLFLKNFANLYRGEFNDK